MISPKKSIFWICILVFLLMIGCASRPLVFLNRAFDFNFIERVAVIPFENISQTQGAGRQATLMFITELLSSETFDVVEPGETAKVLSELNLFSTGTLEIEQIKALGSKLKVQALIFGTVSESTTIRSGSLSIPTITLDLRMVEVETGSTVWSASHSQGRPSLWSSLFGLSGKSKSETMRQCVHKVLKTLIR